MNTDTSSNAERLVEEIATLMPRLVVRRADGRYYGTDAGCEVLRQTAAKWGLRVEVTLQDGRYVING